jgi:hypothetical protein
VKHTPNIIKLDAGNEDTALEAVFPKNAIIPQTSYFM